ncbi:MAG: hypothetical protein HGA45_30290 [Chloroflexales bacterium]|nr:hypothetical protein [Chloroflexales bacterium]
MPQRLATLSIRAAQIALVALATAYLVYFADHARQLLGFAYPLDYGEGPLLAQVEALRAGVPIWRLYADPAATPYLIINYPPLYLLLTAALTPLAGSALSAGRLISLLAALGCVAAIAALAGEGRRSIGQSRSAGQRVASILRPSLFVALLLLTVPIVREWAALMRVDMLGVCLGLWGLVILVRAPRVTALRAALAGLLMAACLLTKPSLIAAPGAAALWLAWRTLRAPAAMRREALVASLSLAMTLALAGGLAFGLLQWASGGWFALHVVAANANRWEAGLARGFWAQQIALRWPLALAATITVAWALWRGRGGALLLAGLYTLIGAVTAAGVGKVGAYSNYFLELYAGLVWLAALGAELMAADQRAPAQVQLPGATGVPSGRPQGAPVRHAATKPGADFLRVVPHATLYALLAASLLYYPPLWDKNRLRQAGLVEPSPPRLALGRYGLWDDAAREADLLAAQARVGAALTAEARAAGPSIFTDMPGVAAGADVVSRLQAFEARQLLDQGLTDEGALLRDLANGAIPLAVIDYLGNWLTPGVIEILQRRYAHDGSVGTFDLYRPVAVGPARPLSGTFPVSGGALRLSGFHLAAPAGAGYEPGELLAIALDWQRDGAQPSGAPTVVVRLTTPDGAPLLEEARPLLYGVYPPDRWPAGEAVQHMQPLALPAELPDGRYSLAVTLREGEHNLAEPQVLTTIEVAGQGGTQFEETGHFVPARLMRAWAELGGVERAGLPLTPAVPFAWGRLQCFERACLELRGEEARPRPLGERLYLAETNRGAACITGKPAADGLCPGFALATEQYAGLGRALSGELERNGWVVQWSEGARLERAPGAGELSLGRLGDESLRLPPGTPYRWP